jgi:hypothetical protein
MLTGMSLIALANTAPAPFNANIYIVAATVIPVWFLAITVQGPQYSDLLKVTAGNYARILERIADSSTPARATGPWIVGALATGLAMVILTVGVIGEVEALVSLSRQKAFGDPVTPVIAAVLLTLVAAAGPAMAFIRTMITIFSPDGRNVTPADEPGQGPGPVQQPSGTESETGKTDPEG